MISSLLFQNDKDSKPNDLIPDSASVDSPSASFATYSFVPTSSTSTLPFDSAFGGLSLDDESGDDIPIPGSSGGAVGLGGGRKASLSLNLFKETARADEAEKWEKSARLRSATTSSSMSRKGKERDFGAEKMTSSPILFSDNSRPRSVTSKSRSNSPRTGASSPSPSKQHSLPYSQSSHNSTTPSGLSNSRPPSPYPFTSGLSNSRPVSPHSSQQYRTLPNSPIPELEFPSAALPPIPAPLIEDTDPFDLSIVTTSTEILPLSITVPSSFQSPNISPPALKLLFSGRIPKSTESDSKSDPIIPSTDSIFSSPSIQNSILGVEKKATEEGGLFETDDEETGTESDCSSESSWSGSEEEGDTDEGEAYGREYEVDVEGILDSNKEATVSIDAGGGSELVDPDPRNVNLATVPLEPFDHQVGGHSHIFRFSKKAVCKVSLNLLCFASRY